MVFRSLILVSLLLLGGTAHSSAAEAPDAISAINAALVRQKLVLTKGVPVLRAR